MTDIPPQLLPLLKEALPEIAFDPALDGNRPFNELGVDSLDKMSLLLAVQEHWNVEFNEAQIKDLRTLQDIAAQLPANA